MKHSEIKEIVSNDGFGHKYKAVKKDGKSEIVRLFQKNGAVYRFAKGRRKYGYPVFDYEDWVKLTPADASEKTNEQIAARMIKRAKDAVKYLNESGFWGSLKAELEYFLQHEELALEIVKDSANMGWFDNVYSKRGEGEKYSWMRTSEVFGAMVGEKCWMSIPWDGRKEYAVSLYERAQESGTREVFRWTSGYDVTYTIGKQEEGEDRGAWLSLEYRNCGNGHYGLLLDATHAVFYEDD